MDERSNGAIPSEAALSLETFDEQRGIRRDPEERPVDSTDQKQVREKMLDKTLADSFPTSDPPSTIPDPSEDSLD